MNTREDQSLQTQMNQESNNQNSNSAQSDEFRACMSTVIDEYQRKGMFEFFMMTISLFPFLETFEAKVQSSATSFVDIQNYLISMNNPQTIQTFFKNWMSGSFSAQDIMNSYRQTLLKSISWMMSLVLEIKNKHIDQATNPGTIRLKQLSFLKSILEMANISVGGELTSLYQFQLNLKSRLNQIRLPAHVHNSVLQFCQHQRFLEQLLCVSNIEVIQTDFLRFMVSIWAQSIRANLDINTANELVDFRFLKLVFPSSINHYLANNMDTIKNSTIIRYGKFPPTNESKDLVSSQSTVPEEDENNGLHQFATSVSFFDKIEE